ncbi:hypothetical protein [Moraxella sp. VT-16-12]|uniref:hypothetical protein n=1 Tax=Moraxella sp. VT-16-12 TaxID=2014877 RepID=UPI000B7CDF38|nr:hypothetical protein [Moraxella sp. VT-16-12]TWV84691.1 DUF4124 domain-containing protein [Moraxella sp. VT-16-12]
MKHLSLIIATITTFALTAHANTTTVYKSVGKHGETLYSQFMPKGTTNYETLQMRSDGRTASAGQMANLPDPATAPTNNDTQRIAEQQKQIDELKAQEEARRCQTMRANLANLSTGGRIYETNANGERVYLNDQEISAKKQRTADAIKQYCGN